MPEFEDSLNLCKAANPLWINQLKTHFSSMAIAIYSLEDNMRFQQNKWGDFLVILDFPDKMLRYMTVETKVHELKYFHKYMTNGKSILFEVMGNVNLKRKGSAFLDSNADVYATAYMNNARDGLIGLNYFHVTETKRWLAPRIGNYPRIVANTGGQYETTFILIPLAHIPLECRSSQFV